jgi:hypothetical protein
VDGSPKCRGVNLIQPRKIFLRLALRGWVMLATNTDDVAWSIEKALALPWTKYVVPDFDGMSAAPSVYDPLTYDVAVPGERFFEARPRDGLVQLPCRIVLVTLYTAFVALMQIGVIKPMLFTKPGEIAGPFKTSTLATWAFESGWH